MSSDSQTPAIPELDKGKLLGLVEAVLKSHVYRIDDYMDSEGEPMKVIPAEDIAHIMSELDRRWDAPANWAVDREGGGLGVE